MIPRCSCDYDPPAGIATHAADCALAIYHAKTAVRRWGPLTPAADAIGDMISATMLAAGVPEAEESFSMAMARVEELREANRVRLERRDRAEWDCFFHFACENSLLKRQAE